MKIIFDESCAPALKRLFEYLGLEVEEQSFYVDSVAGTLDTWMYVKSAPADPDPHTLAARLAAARKMPSAEDASDSTEFSPLRGDIPEMPI